MAENIDRLFALGQTTFCRLYSYSDTAWYLTLMRPSMEHEEGGHIEPPTDFVLYGRSAIKKLHQELSAALVEAEMQAKETP